MTNFQPEISFSQPLAKRRIEQATELFGAKTINRIMAISLFLLGGNREQISKFLGFSIGTMFSFLTRFHSFGVHAFIDQREKPKVANTEDREIKKAPIGLEFVFGEQKKVFCIPSAKWKLTVNSSNHLQFKTLVLSFMNSGVLTAKQASEQLRLSERHVRELGKNLEKDDIESLIDKRQGQQKNYVFSEEIQAELIQQFTANIITKRSTSSSEITKQVNEACSSTLSDRTVREYVSKLGLSKIKESLPELLNTLKKTPISHK